MAVLVSTPLTFLPNHFVMQPLREHFVKPGIIESEYSDLYGAVMESRISSDYEIIYDTDQSLAEKSLDAAQCFVERMSRYRSPLYHALQKEGIALIPQLEP